MVGLISFFEVLIQNGVYQRVCVPGQNIGFQTIVSELLELVLVVYNYSYIGLKALKEGSV